MREQIEVGTTVIMPEPKNDDLWNIGGFIGQVVDIFDNQGLAIVEDQDSDFWTVEIDRLKVFLD